MLGWGLLESPGSGDIERVWTVSKMPAGSGSSENYAHRGSGSGSLSLPGEAWAQG